MASTRISSNYPPNIDPTRAPEAYGIRKVPKLNQALRDKDLITRQRALMTLSDKLHGPEHVSEAIRVGVVPKLLRLLKDADVVVREKSTECSYVIAGHAVGRAALLNSVATKRIAELFDDPADVVRHFAYKTMGRIAEQAVGAEQIVQADLLPSLVGKLQSEQSCAFKEHILDTLHSCLMVEATSALVCGALEVLRDFLAHESVQIRAKAALAMMDVCFALGGKEQACEIGCIAPLVELLAESSRDVLANATGALAAISTTTRGKYATYKAGAIRWLVELTKHRSSEVRVNSLKALTMLAEIPDARTELLGDIAKLRDCVNDKNSAVGKHASIAVGVVTWTP
ncbi:PREDICTED: radial spoke head 14 homolog [Priapulus caudatus]|uniref:Radial spoke head 14 homolog n=1 Tax=Priapulus caudatus TaxID=37621 RepID=A0ABM1F064_PRICU|nr:PREDICTED: radial spoke head 14 homolog [Priapulus caudatus]